MATTSVFYVILLYSIAVVSALYTDIYRVLDAAPCVLLLDKDGPVGCTSPQGGIDGDLYVIRNKDEYDYFNQNLPDEPKAVAVPANLFNKDLINRFHADGKVKGVLVLYGPPAENGWSPDDQIPNQQWGLQPSDVNAVWNPPGDSLNFVKIPFPVYALSQNESVNILALATNDTSYPRSAVQFHTFMHATKDAKTCMRRNQCIPLGGKSVWASFDKVGTRPIVMGMANIDSTAIFHDLATGADATASGIVGLIGAALALQNVDRSGFVKDIIFAFWAGESWGYLGSKKFLNDIQNFECAKPDTSTNSCNEPYKPDLTFENIKLDQIQGVIEVNQIGLQDDATKTPVLYIHQQGDAVNPISSLLETISANTTLSLKPVSGNASREIPPSSLMSFLSASPSLSGVVVTDHAYQYTNLNYHSHMDTGALNALSNDTLCNTATILARSLYLMATGQSQPDEISLTINAPCSLLSDLAVCLSSNFNCALLDNFLSPNRPPIPTYYTGVFGYSIQNAYASAPAVLLYNMLTLITASNVKYNFTSFNYSGDVPAQECKKCEFNQTCINNFCVNSETHFHDAISLGFDWDYSSNMWIIVNESEPLWVESNWDSLGVELFRRANPSSEGIFLAAGIIEFIISLVAVYYAKRYFMRNYKIF